MPDDNYDRADLKLAALALDTFARTLRQQWKHLDRLYSEKSYIEQEYHRSRNKRGEISNEELIKAWKDIDVTMEKYDFRVLDRKIFLDWVYALAERMWKAAKKVKGVKSDKSESRNRKGL
jgi:hypothetical protein